MLKVKRKSRGDSKTKAEREHLGRVAQMACILSSRRPVQVHHITDEAGRLGDFFVLPLHPDYHVGKKGFSGSDRGAWDKSFENQIKLCRQVYRRLGKIMPEIPVRPKVQRIPE